MSWGFALFGAALPLVYDTPMFALHRDRVALWSTATTSPVATLPSDSTELLSLVSGILGGSIAGKWVAHAWIVRRYLAGRARWARNASLAGLAVWFVTDSSVSIAIGATFNVWMINLMPLVLFGAPLIWAWRDLDHDAPPSDVATKPSDSSRTLLLVISAVFAVVGAVIAVAFDTGLFSWWYDALATAQFSGNLPAHAHRLVRFFMGPIGGCIAAHFVLLAALTHHAIANDRKGVRDGFLVSIGAWFVIDSAAGLLHHGVFNVLSVNVVTFLVVLPVLMIATRANAR